MKNHIKNNWKMFLESFKELDRRLIFILLYDLLFLLIFFAASFIFYNKFVEKSAIVNALPLEQITVSQDIAKSVLSNLNGFLYFLAVAPILFLIVIFIAMSISKILIWFSVTKNNITLKSILKFIGIRALWFLISLGITILMTPLFILIYYAIQLKAIIFLTVCVLILLIILVFFNNIKMIMYIEYTKNSNISSIKKAFILGIKKFKIFILPYIIVLVFFIVFFNIYYYLFYFLFHSIVPLTEPIKSAFFYMAIPFLIFFAWFRLYFYNIVKSLEI